MTIYVLVEGASERAFFERWGRRLLKDQELRVHPHQGKGNLPDPISARPNPRARGLLDQLPAKLRGFGQALDPQRDFVLVLVDADDDDPTALVASIQEAATRFCPGMTVLVSIAVEEMEAF